MPSNSLFISAHRTRQFRVCWRDRPRQTLLKSSLQPVLLPVEGGSDLIEGRSRAVDVLNAVHDDAFQRCTHPSSLVKHESIAKLRDRPTDHTIRGKKRKEGDNTAALPCIHTCGDEDPGRVEAHVVDPKVLKLGPAVRNARVALGGVAGRVVQRHAVEVCDADDDLERVAQAAAAGDGHGRREAQRAPRDLRARIDSSAFFSFFLCIPV